MADETNETCSVCGVGKMALVREPLTREVHIKYGKLSREGELREVTVEDEEFFMCDSCGERVYDPEQAARSSQKVREAVEHMAR